MKRLSSIDSSRDPEQTLDSGDLRESDPRRIDDEAQTEALRALQNSSSESFVRGFFVGLLFFLLLVGALSTQASQPAATEVDGVPPQSSEASSNAH